MSTSMTGQLDTTTNAPTPQKGTAGSAHVVVTDSNGAPVVGGMPVVVQNEAASPANVKLVDGAGVETGTIANPIAVDITDATVVISSDNLNVAEVETASDGARIEPNRYDHVMTFTGAKVSTITIVVGAITYRRTLSYTGDNLTGITKWTVV